MNDEIYIGKFIKYFRQQKNLTQVELSEGICNKDHLYAIEKGKYEPSLYILQEFSKRLNVDLFAYRHDIMGHSSFEAHEMFTTLNNYLFTSNITELKKYIPICEKHSSFDNGEPYLLLLYSKALVAFREDDFDSSLSICLKGLKEMNIDPHFDQNILSQISNVGLLIIQHYAITLHITEKLDEALLVYNLLYNEYRYVLERPIFELNKALHFQSTNFMIVSYNLGVLYCDKGRFDKAEQYINEALGLSRKTKYIDMYIPLLLCLIDVYYNTNRIEQAQKIFDDIPTLVKYHGQEHYYEDFLKCYKEYLPLLEKK